MLSVSSAQQEAVRQVVREARRKVDQHLPAGSVYPRHTSEGHFYGVPNGETYSSVTGVISYVKDQSIQLYQMNEALRYLEANLHRCIKDGKFDMMEAGTVMYEAKKAPSDAMNNAGDIGRQIHDRREEYFQAWIDNHDEFARPDIATYLKSGDDPRIISAMRALDKFCEEHQYIPVRTEVMVYTDKYKLAGTLDDVGYIRTVKKEGDPKCAHVVRDSIVDSLTSVCDCGFTVKWEFALSDLKSSNQFKDSYFYQVALYLMMFKENTGLNPSRAFILKVSKDNGMYTIEELIHLSSLVAGAKKIIQAAEAVNKVRLIRQKSTAKTVTKI